MNNPVAWRYDLTSINGEGWATVLLTSDGFFAAVTDYGNYAHMWPAHALTIGFREFICKVEAGYLLTKIAYKEYDGEATAAAIRKVIRESRKLGGLTKEQAREERILLEEHDEVSCLAAYATWFNETKLEPGFDFTCDRWPAQAASFAEKTLPRLKAAIQAELEQEASARAGGGG
jgi:hypothetical protein